MVDGAKRTGKWVNEGEKEWVSHEQIVLLPAALNLILVKSQRGKTEIQGWKKYPLASTQVSFFCHPSDFLNQTQIVRFYQLDLFFCASVAYFNPPAITSTSLEMSSVTLPPPPLFWWLCHHAGSHRLQLGHCPTTLNSALHSLSRSFRVPLKAESNVLIPFWACHF